MDLQHKKCLPCEGGIAPLGEDTVNKLATQIPEWQIRADGLSLNRIFTFKNFKQAIKFVNALAEVAEAEGHHPDITINWNRVTLALTTHAAGGLTENDFIVAAKINSLTISGA